MYTLSTPVAAVTGIGPALSSRLELRGIATVLDLLLQVPLHYRDYTQFSETATLEPKQLVTIQAEVLSVRRIYRSRRPMTTAVVADQSGKTTLYWFNNNFVHQTLKVGSVYTFSGTVSPRKTLIQPAFEAITTSVQLHTNRLVPQYTSTLEIKQGSLRRILRHILDELQVPPDALTHTLAGKYPTRHELFEHLHFPDAAESVILARERLALEELLSIMQYSTSLKESWQASTDAQSIPTSEPVVPPSIPFTLTTAQQRVCEEILRDLTQSYPMNRLLLGDVGSGKTVVAGIAAVQTIRAGKSVVMIAPTRILAEQHYKTLQALFPEVTIQLVVGGSKQNASTPSQQEPALWVGTHSLLRRLGDLQPGLVIYDEQQRFGVRQRSEIQALTKRPHLLTMTATPIPRTLLLTLFSHLSVSHIDELPKNRIPTKTWVLPEEKRAGLYDWLRTQITATDQSFQALIVCPFINQSEQAGFSEIASATEMVERIRTTLGDVARIGLLHSKLAQPQRDAVITALFAGELDILVTTPIVEVGVDLPQASLMIIESAERYGMASLHQLRGRVGRAGQQGYCALFTSGDRTLERLEFFSKTLDGQQLAELDLQNRGAGDLFGTQQHGFSELQYGSWTNLALISTAQQIFEKIPSDWQSLVPIQYNAATDVPLAN